MRKLNRTQLRAWTLNYLKVKQGGLCALCGLPISIAKTEGRNSDYVADHDHTTGEIRGVLHRSCNAAEGKVANAAGRWGAKSMQYDQIVPWLKALVGYLESAGAGVIYPTHQTPEELHQKSLQKRRVERARAKARAHVKEKA